MSYFIFLEANDNKKKNDDLEDMDLSGLEDEEENDEGDLEDMDLSGLDENPKANKKVAKAAPTANTPSNQQNTQQNVNSDINSTTMNQQANTGNVPQGTDVNLQGSSVPNAEGVPGGNTEMDGTLDDVDTTEENLANSEVEEMDEQEAEEQVKENKKRYTLFLNYKKLANIAEKFTDDFASQIINVDTEEENTINNYINRKLYTLTKNINYVMEENFEQSDMELLNTIFIKCKTEISMLIDLYKKEVLPYREGNKKN